MSSDGFSNSQKNTIWENHFGNAIYATDKFGISMSKHDFECDHIYPKSLGGKTVIKNGQPLSSKANIEKSDDLSGKINGRMFRVTQVDQGIGQMTVS